MKSIIIIFSTLILTGCFNLTVVPSGYYQPHMYHGEQEVDTKNLATVYGSCGELENSSKGFIGVWGVDSIAITPMYAIKVYVKPGKRTLRIGVNDGHYSKALDMEHEFIAGHKYQIVTNWGKSDGGFFEGYHREFNMGVLDMGENYIPTKGIYREHDHSDPLVIKDPLIDVSHHDCVFKKYIHPLSKSHISPEHKKVFIDMGYDL